MYLPEWFAFILFNLPFFAGLAVVAVIVVIALIVKKAKKKK